MEYGLDIPCDCGEYIVRAVVESGDNVIVECVGCEDVVIIDSSELERA